jgi:predicted O-methyltransferase YrrM
LILHDLIPDGEIIIDDEKLKNIFCLSQYHVDFVQTMFPTLKNKIVECGYGIDSEMFEHKKVMKTPYKFIYSSFPNRGLLQLLRMWPKIVERYPNASLHLHCDVDGDWVNSVAPDEMAKIKDLIRVENNIVYHGWTSKSKLYENWLSSDVWFYPSTFLETFCLTAFEAGISKTLCVTSSLGALKYTIGDRGVLIDGDASTPEWHAKALDILFNVLETPGLKERYVEMNYNWVKNISWRKRSYDLLDTYLLKDKKTELMSLLANDSNYKFVDNELNYLGMYNWTNDIPQDTKQIFEDVLDYFNFKNNTKMKTTSLLEIGVYAGISLINLLRYIPNSTAYGIDSWTAYDESDFMTSVDMQLVEQTCYNNIRTVSMTDRINILKGDSYQILLNFIKEGNMMFDFIYIDGSHKCFDAYSDLVLSFSLLSKGGILGVDDVLYRQDQMKFSPFEAVNHFVAKFKDKIKIINSGYRIFIEKL